ncbi:PREDICTED: putative F-box/kelch-repeat protein At3g24610 isoform X2 [Camelina sativa]|uniref:F-box/kelch-repeat protein At3g24610 isoform X2 n=1 Tax=Camelina sativa TaxID=90675 RepID=A0ABM0XYA0_CAMSA|nr:PREDICTED: putative F-box/kelch-repeat protein At3g24610 isoform X2 [Camelina sativa]
MWCDPLSGVRQGAMVWRHVYGLNALKPFLSIYSDPDSSLISFHGDLADVWQCYLLNHGHKDGLLGFMPDNKLLTSSRGNILVFWDVLVGDADPKTLEIWCAEISMQMWEGYMWGNVLWSEAVFSTDPRFGFQIPVQGGLPLRESLTKEVKTKSGQEHEFRFLRMTADCLP